LCSRRRWSEIGNGDNQFVFQVASLKIIRLSIAHKLDTAERECLAASAVDRECHVVAMLESLCLTIYFNSNGGISGHAIPLQFYRLKVCSVGRQRFHSPLLQMIRNILRGEPEAFRENLAALELVGG
jgi:hypothetical protein